MNNQNIQGTASGDTVVQLWDPVRALKRVDVHEALLSKGFLRCRPEKWFPGFNSHWLPVTHALGCQAEIVEVRPVPYPPTGSDEHFVGSIDGEYFLLSLDRDSAKAVVEEVSPGATLQSSRIVLDYLARRMIASLALSWSGPESSKVRYEPDYQPSSVSTSGAVKISFAVNTRTFSIWIGLGQRLIEKLDGLWRRQIQSSARVSVQSATVAVEIAQLGVPPQMLSDYLKAGTVIDLEVRASESITLRISEKAWMPAKLVEIDGKFGCEISPGVLQTPTVPEGTTRLSVILGTVTLDGGAIAENSQSGAILSTDIPLSGLVSLVINGDTIGSARLCVYEGRFAIEVQ